MAHSKYPAAINNENNRKLTIGIFLGAGVVSLQSGDLYTSAAFAVGVITLESYEWKQIFMHERDLIVSFSAWRVLDCVKQ